MKALALVLFLWPSVCGPATIKPGKVNYEACHRMEKCFGVDSTLLASMRLEENGGYGFELGHYGRTTWIQATFPKDEWQYAEAARSVAKFSVEFGMKHRKEYLAYLAQRYTHKDHAKTWARNVDLIQRKEKSPPCR